MDIGAVLGEIIIFKKIVLSPAPLMLMTNNERKQMIKEANRKARLKEKRLAYRLSKSDWDINTCEEYFQKH